MFIEEVVLQGFKTYVNRTVISGFDSQFNAITGLNGSGKSNILDAIQFLLGSTNKQMLRLSSAGLVDLISNGGSVNKANVSIKFRCVDKNMRPTGYENCEELLVTRQITKDKITKFFVNGLSSNLTKVKSLFRSIHLNIENPHFLVKQGRITKIINLKPTQLLGMIEETAGTAIYNKTKQDSEKMIDKKAAKLNSINEILKTSIEPQIQKLNADRQRYTMFKNRQSEMKELHEVIKVYEYVTKKKTIQKKEYEINHLRDSFQSRTITQREQIERLAELEGQIKILRNASSSKVQSEYHQIKKKLQTRQNQCKQRRKRIQSLTNESISTREEISYGEEAAERKRQELQWKSKELIHQEKQKEEIDILLTEINASKGGEGEAEKLLEKQINQERAQIEEFSEEIKLMKTKLKTLQNQAKMEEKNQTQFQETKNNLNQSLATLEAEISQLESLAPPKQIEDPELTSNYLKKLENDRNRLIQSHYHLRFSYNDPEPHFDKTKIKGKLFMLFKAKEKIHEKALEIGAGGKLTNIVVVDQTISKLVIEKQTFGKSVAVVPNNKITFKKLKPQVIEEVKKIAQSLGGCAKPAYQLIDYEKNIQNSIMFGFSAFIVCSSNEIAKRIAYNQNLQCKCVTYDGDVLEPGTLTGGHMKMGELLIGLQRELRQIEDKIMEERKKYNEDRKKYIEYEKKQEQYKFQKKDLEGKKGRREKIKQRITNLSLSMKKRNFKEQMSAINKRIQELERELQIHENKLEELKRKKKKGGKSIGEQKKQMVGVKKEQEGKINELKKTSSLIQVQMESMTRKIETMRRNDEKNQEEIIGMEQELTKIEADLKIIKKQFEEKEEEKIKIEKEQAMNESRLKLLLEEQSTLKQENYKNQSKIMQTKKNIDEIQNILENTGKELNEVMKECPWLVDGKEYECPPNFNYEQAMRRYSDISIDVDKLRKTVKITIDDHSYEKLQEEYKNLREKRETLEKDKVTLLNNMKDLDDKRTKTLQSCYAIVKDNLAKIFNDLLPGATAHLNLVDKNDVTLGAQLQIQFNKVKKQLNELSGGQRSLLALSFILALLLYKPSPFYILDEIDSALDLSHTENIGYMISQRFPQSQFVIISLKEGMFQNANVLYKVHFSDGESKVERQVIKKK